MSNNTIVLSHNVTNDINEINKQKRDEQYIHEIAFECGIQLIMLIPQIRIIGSIARITKIFKLRKSKSINKSMSFSKAKAQFKEKLSNDPKIGKSTRGYLKNQYKQKKSWYKVKNPPGTDVGHRVRGQHDPNKFKLEWSRDNRSRGARFERGTDNYKKEMVVDIKGKKYLKIDKSKINVLTTYIPNGMEIDKAEDILVLGNTGSYDVIDLNLNRYIQAKFEESLVLRNSVFDNCREISTTLDNIDTTNKQIKHDIGNMVDIGGVADEVIYANKINDINDNNIHHIKTQKDIEVAIPTIDIQFGPDPGNYNDDGFPAYFFIPLVTITMPLNCCVS